MGGPEGGGGCTGAGIVGLKMVNFMFCVLQSINSLKKKSQCHITPPAPRQSGSNLKRPTTNVFVDETVDKLECSHGGGRMCVSATEVTSCSEAERAQTWGGLSEVLGTRPWAHRSASAARAAV